MKTIIAAVTSITVALCLTLIAALIMAAVIQFFWNLSVPYLFHAPIIGYWQAFSVYILVNILTKSITTTTSK